MHPTGLGAMHGYEGPNQTGRPGYEGYLNQRTVSLARLFQDSGYKTYMAGKWRLGETAKTLPGAKGAYFEDGVDRTGTPVPDDFFPVTSTAPSSSNISTAERRSMHPSSPT